MTDYADLVNYIRAQTEWCSRSLSGGDWFSIDPDNAPFRAAGAIETLLKDVGDYKSMNTTLLRERDEARAERDLWKKDADRQRVLRDEYEKKHQLWNETISRRAEAAEAEVARLRQVLTTLSTETNISQEERKFHARAALEAK